MSIKLNKDLLLWAIAVLQPASASDALLLISRIFPEMNSLPKVKDVESILNFWRIEGFINRVHAKSRLYSTTYKANSKLSLTLRRNRDKSRLFLLKSIRNVKCFVSGEREKDLVGDSPTTNGSTILQEGARPIKAADALRETQNLGRFYWPRVSKQLESTVGPKFSSPDTFFKYYSFPTIKHIHTASHLPAKENDLSITDLALCIGISPRLMTSFIHAAQNHYREFEIGKRGGGVRVIHSPRTFLKVVQYWIVDYLLYKLQCHRCCHSYQRKKSIISNALPHLRKAYVANLDIKDYFPSISTDMVNRLLIENDFGEQLSKAVSRLVTLKNMLPQGAPTSPTISNSILYKFDEKIFLIANSYDLTYTRYADDLTISGYDKEKIITTINAVEKELLKKNLSINEGKTRIASNNGQQKVTGVVVNEAAQPSKKVRKKIRAIFHNAKKDQTHSPKKLKMLRGYISYIQSFPHLREDSHTKKYLEVYNKLKKQSEMKIKI